LSGVHPTQRGLFQGHKSGTPEYVTRVNLDVDDNTTAEVIANARASRGDDHGGH
jgi:hypothetical protein